jgi:hypothetical protein
MAKFLSKEILSTEQEEDFSKLIKPSIWHQLQIWVDDQGRYHREDGPAIINKDGSMEWHLHGEWHREDGPAVMTIGWSGWFKNGRYHREDGPAFISHATNQESYFLDGRSCAKQEIEIIQMYKNAGKK